MTNTISSNKILLSASILGSLLNGIGAIFMPLWTSGSPYPAHGQSVQVKPPDDVGRPPATDPGPDRRDCEDITNSFIPITPYYLGQVPESLQYQRYGLSSQNNPTIWFYIPYESELIKSVNFRLWRWEGNMERTRVYNADMQTPEQGLVAVTLDNLTHNLESGSWYQATLSIQAYCDESSPAISSKATTWIQTSTLRNSVDGLPFPDQVLTYLANGFWYDAADLQTQRYCQENTPEAFSDFLALGNLSTDVVLDETPQCTIANFQSK